jgi:hypothetical protein
MRRYSDAHKLMASYWKCDAACVAMQDEIHGAKGVHGILRSCVRNRIGKTKTESSCRPVPLHPLVLNAPLEEEQQAPSLSLAEVEAVGVDHVGMGSDTDLLSSRGGQGTNKA